MEERAISERLLNSMESIYLDLVPDKTPKGIHNDLLLTFIDRDMVVDDCKGDKEKMRAVIAWVMTQVLVRLPGRVRNDQKLTQQLVKKFGGAFNPSRLKVTPIEYQSKVGPNKKTQVKFWFKIYLG